MRRERLIETGAVGKHTTRFTVRLPIRLHVKYEELARRKNLTISQITRRLVTALVTADEFGGKDETCGHTTTQP